MSTNPTPEAVGPHLQAAAEQLGTTAEELRADVARFAARHGSTPETLLAGLARAGRVQGETEEARKTAPLIHYLADLAPLPPGPPHLPAPMRILTPQELRAIRDSVRAAARRTGVPGDAADDISCDALAAAGLFLPPPDPEPDTCAALFLPHELEEFGPELLGQWQQCEDEPGHDGDQHACGDTEWGDAYPGAVPARAEGEA